MAPSFTKPRKSLWRLSGLTPLQLAHNVIDGLRRNESIGRSSQLAFDFLFALFPLILLMLTQFGLFASNSIELQTHLLSYFSNFLPPVAFQILRTTTTELAVHASRGKLTFDIVAALWFASGGVASMFSALNLAYRVQETRSWLKVRAIAVALTVLISTLVLMALLLVLVSTHFLDWIGAELRLQPIVVQLGKIFQWPAAILFVMMSYSLIYFASSTLNARQWHSVTPGSAFGTLLWLLASLGFREYLQFYNAYSSTYGSFGAVMILLIWLYVSGLAFLVGGEINAELERAACNLSLHAEQIPLHRHSR